jgi:hypothetical protein
MVISDDGNAFNTEVSGAKQSFGSLALIHPIVRSLNAEYSMPKVNAKHHWTLYHWVY